MNNVITYINDVFSTYNEETKSFNKAIYFDKAVSDKSKWNLFLIKLSDLQKSFFILFMFFIPISLTYPFFILIQFITPLDVPLLLNLLIPGYLIFIFIIFRLTKDIDTSDELIFNYINNKEIDIFGVGFDDVVYFNVPVYKEIRSNYLKIITDLKNIELEEDRIVYIKHRFKYALYDDCD